MNLDHKPLTNIHPIKEDDALIFDVVIRTYEGSITSFVITLNQAKQLHEKLGQTIDSFKKGFEQ